VSIIVRTPAGKRPLAHRCRRGKYRASSAFNASSSPDWAFSNKSTDEPALMFVMGWMERIIPSAFLLATRKSTRDCRIWCLDPSRR
jgi:hypothetical protein